jgi:octaheme c-type cytochrome (tetrathionate reductase family)
MDVRRTGCRGLVSLVSAVFLAAFMAGCADDGKDGIDGTAGAPGAPGADGTDGISCWDLNENGVADLPDEDTNGDGVVNVEDCRTAGGAYDPAGLHAGFFKQNPYEGTQDCLYCHGKLGDEILETGHWKWQGLASNLEGFEGEIHGKNDIINNFCIAVPSNEGRCTQCHIGYGYVSKSFDFEDPKNIDCLVCHDQTGSYKKAPAPGGVPDASVDLQAVAQSVGEGGGIPTRKACLFCHAQAGGGDNVKHGDLYLKLAATTREYDVHMGVDNKVGGYTCTDCHGVKKVDGELVSHGIGGMPYHSVDEGALKTCEDCHGSAATVHAGTSAQTMVNAHPALACQACHIPAIARDKATKVEWYWESAGDKDAEIPIDPDTGEKLYDWMKGTFVWKNNVRPTLRYSDGKWNKALIGVNDVFPKTGPAQLAYPTADRFTPGAKIYPFKKMVGNQPVADEGANWKFIVPHLWGPAGQGGPNAYWSKLDWDLALQDGALYTGQFYQPGTYVFAPTEMLLSVNHEVAPKEMALGYQNGCDDCHLQNQIDWAALGCTADPAVVAGACPDND